MTIVLTDKCPISCTRNAKDLCLHLPSAKQTQRRKPDAIDRIAARSASRATAQMEAVREVDFLRGFIGLRCMRLCRYRYWIRISLHHPSFEFRVERPSTARYGDVTGGVTCCGKERDPWRQFVRVVADDECARMKERRWFRCCRNVLGGIKSVDLQL